MLRIIILLPLILSLVWIGYLKFNRYSLADGKQGFKYIFIFSSVIAAFFTLMYFVTQS
ncbi:hypothetical protein [Aestuariibacter sp. GS-14]|uniref:hypothetical protein n=1 Tax=Aestuariibacter sp. GS-14 TaxID=2590670 RepID=UPI0015E83DEB|nr:hypothetical protein [Aestuariibacter sp. GS-14]